MDRPILDILDYFSGHMGGWHMGQTVWSAPIGYSLAKMKIKTYVQIHLVTRCRKKMNKSENRQKMAQVMKQPKHKQIYKESAYRVEPMQGLVKEIFDLDRCWIRGGHNNRWIFGAMGLTIQMHELKTYRENRSTWNIKDEVLGQIP